MWVFSFQTKVQLMRYTSLLQTALRWLLLAVFLHAGIAMAQQEPSMGQIYATAKAGKLDEAQVMVQQVLVAHPKSAKAYFVQSELYARQGNLSKAREALSTAQGLAPGLPFAKPEALQALQSQLAARPTAPPATKLAPDAAPVPAQSSGSWLLPALLAVGAIAAGYFIFRRKPAQTFDQNPGFGNGLNGPQSFGNGSMQPAMQPGMQGGYGQQPMYGQQGYGQPAGSGIGGRIMGGVATGLAVGAGVMAAEAIGRNLMGNHDTSARSADNSSANNYEPIGSSNADMGGQNFGVSDTGWDDAGSADVGGGGDWDN
jgi:tetratricopeptide (TPR) repeat protein